MRINPRDRIIAGHYTRPCSLSLQLTLTISLSLSLPPSLSLSHLLFLSRSPSLLFFLFLLFREFSRVARPPFSFSQPAARGRLLILMIPLYSIQKYQCYPILRKIGFNYDCQARVDPFTVAPASSWSLTSVRQRANMWNSIPK